MENLQAEKIIVSSEVMRAANSEPADISMPLQNLFDECLSYISINNFIIG